MKTVLEPNSETFVSRLTTGFMRLFFRLLYHSMAWSYDLVAAAVSLGQWKSWVKTAVGLLNGPRVLELGYGPGHLQTYLQEAGFTPFGLDESRQMAHQAHRRLARRGQPPRLARGLSQRLPFAAQSFDCVIATFPTQYITDPETLAEIQRVLKPGAGSRLVVLMYAWMTGQRPWHRFMRWLYRVTGESPQEDLDLARIVEPYQKAGFQASMRFIELPDTRLMFILSRKSPK